jgi:hypothetical protein
MAEEKKLGKGETITREFTHEHGHEFSLHHHDNGGEGSDFFCV